MENIDFVAQRGEICLILGDSEVEKSGILGGVLGKYPVSRGKIALGNFSLANLAPGTIGAIEQHPQVIGGLALGDNLRLATSGATDDEMREVVSAVGLEAILGTILDGMILEEEAKKSRPGPTLASEPGTGSDR